MSGYLYRAKVFNPGYACDPGVFTNNALLTILPDHDKDGIPDDIDDDDDNDGILDTTDTNPLDPYICGDIDGDTWNDCSVLGYADEWYDGVDVVCSP